MKRKISRLAGRHQTARTPENLRALAETVAESPEKSVRLRLFASGLQISVTSAWRILRKDLGLFPYTISMTHKLTERDCERRQRMSNEFLFRIADDPLWLNNVWFSDESHIYLSGKSIRHIAYSGARNNQIKSFKPPCIKKSNCVGSSEIVTFSTVKFWVAFVKIGCLF